MRTTTGSTKKPAAKTPPAGKPKKCPKCLGMNGKHKELCPDNRCAECRVTNGMDHLSGCSLATATPKRGVRVSRVTVDGKDAIKRDLPPTPEGAAPARSLPFPPIELLPNALGALQSQIDSGDFSGDKQTKEKCQFEDPVHGKCTHLAPMSKVVKQKCETCGHSHKEVIERFCIGHGVNVWGGNAPSRLQTEMDLT